MKKNNYNNDKYYKNNYSRTNYNYKKDNKILNNNIPEKYLYLLKRVWPSPSVLSNSILLSTSLDKFNYTDKIDGIHTHLLIFDKNI